MKKIIFMFMACVASMCVYANTCIYDGVAVSLYSESVSSTPTGAWIYISVNKTNIRTVRCQIECNGRREWVTIGIDENGKGSLDISNTFPMQLNMNYKVTLVAGAGQCY